MFPFIYSWRRGGTERWPNLLKVTEQVRNLKLEHVLLQCFQWMHWEPARYLAQSLELGIRKMNSTPFLSRGAYALMLALAGCGSSGSYFNIWSSWYLLLGLWALWQNRSKPGTACGSEHLMKYTWGSKFNLAATCKMQTKRIFLHLSILQKLK